MISIRLPGTMFVHEWLREPFFFGDQTLVISQAKKQWVWWNPLSWPYLLVVLQTLPRLEGVRWWCDGATVFSRLLCGRATNTLPGHSMSKWRNKPTKWWKPRMTSWRWGRVSWALLQRFCNLGKLDGLFINTRTVDFHTYNYPLFTVVCIHIITETHEGCWFCTLKDDSIISISTNYRHTFSTINHQHSQNLPIFPTATHIYDSLSLLSLSKYICIVYISIYHSYTITYHWISQNTSKYLHTHTPIIYK